VLGGEIIAINQSAGVTLVTVSQGSVLGKYGDLPHLKVVFAKGAAGSGPSLSKTGCGSGSRIPEPKDVADYRRITA
jgi:hypothetical protein